MKKSFLTIGLALGTTLLFFMPTKLQSQSSCPNLNFSFGNFTGWDAYAGTWTNGPQRSPITANRHAIMDAEALILQNILQDEICPAIPKVPPGFMYSAKLGNMSTNAELEALEYTMTVDSNNSLLVLHFAWVLEDPGHDASQQPKFTMEVRDSLGRPYAGLSCNHIEFISSPGLPGLICNTGSFVARTWTTVGFSLESLMGKKIKIYYETRDCSATAHYGYAYLVAECRPMRIELEFCAGQTVARMQGPVGFTQYKWTRSSDLTWVIQGDENKARQIAVQDAYEGEIFTCEVMSELGLQCSASAKVEIRRTSIDADFGYGIKDANGHVPYWDWPHNGLGNWYDTCTRTATFVDFTTVRNSKKDHILWEIFDPTGGTLASSQDSLFTVTFPDPDSTPVTYRVRLTGFAENGCTDTSKNREEQRITIYPSPKIKITGETQMCEGDTVGLKATTIRSVFVEHLWTWTDTNGTHTSTDDSITIFAPNTFVLESKDSAGCYATDTHKVTPLRPQLKKEVTDISCYGDVSGKFTHGPITGGESPYQPYYWIFPDEDGNTDDTIVPAGYTYGAYTGLRAGIYRFEAWDLHDCYLSGEFEIKQSDSLKISGIQYSTTCNENNGRLKLNATGGLPPYQFEIKDSNGTIVMPLIKSSPGVPNPDSAAGLKPGLYTITVTDAVDDKPAIDRDDTTITRIPKMYSCTTSDTIRVLATAMPSVNFDVIMESCEEENGVLMVRPVSAAYPSEFTLHNMVNYSEDTINESGIYSNLKGDKIYSITMTDGNKCRVDSTVYVGSYPSIRADVEKTAETCGRSDGTITLTVNDRPDIIDPETGDITNDVVYDWIDLPYTTAALTGLKTGTYKVEINDGICFWDTTIVVEHINGPIANFESNSYNVASNTIFTLTDISQGTVRIWDWDMGDGNTQAGRIVYYTYPATGDYLIFLEVTDENGCIDTISKIIHIYEELNVFIPNMFTPFNGDGINDKWGPKMSEYTKEGYQLSIFDRWGQRIFHTTDTDELWDGTVKGKQVAPNSVYSYRIIVRDFTGQEYEFVGRVTVLE